MELVACRQPFFQGQHPFLVHLGAIWPVFYRENSKNVGRCCVYLDLTTHYGKYLQIISVYVHIYNIIYIYIYTILIDLNFPQVKDCVKYSTPKPSGSSCVALYICVRLQLSNLFLEIVFCLPKPYPLFMIKSFCLIVNHHFG